MPDRRRVAAKAIIAAGAYLIRISTSGIRIRNLANPVGRTNHRHGRQLPGELDVGEAPSLAAALENSIFEALEDTTIA